MFFGLKKLKVKKLILFITDVSKYLLANIFKFCFKFLKTQNFDFEKKRGIFLKSM